MVEEWPPTESWLFPSPAMLPPPLTAEEFDDICIVLLNGSTPELQDGWVATQSAAESPEDRSPRCSYSGAAVSTACPSPSSPSSVAYPPPYYQLSLLKPDAGQFARVMVERAVLITAAARSQSVAIKSEPEFVSVPPATSYHQPLPLSEDTSYGSAGEEDRERVRRRQRGYEKTYRARKRVELEKTRKIWLALEMKLDAARKKHCRPLVRAKLAKTAPLQAKMKRLLEEERALRRDRVALETLRAWDEISLIREYVDKKVLRTMSEWQHNTEKVIGRNMGLGPSKFSPYAPIQLNFTW
ncbi:hypothetical protein BBJ28_00005969 [Nothophytophthora sp. Chile5]|nr:hypothetical protein BBJ28_00005969 [Nothophytophthora sp. Chile5]